MWRFLRLTGLVIASTAIIFSAAAQEAGVSSYQIQIGPSLVSGGEAASGRIAVARDPSVPRESLVFKLSSSNNSLVRFANEVITIASNQDTATFAFSTAATPIRTIVTIHVSLGPSFRTTVSSQIELVPALLKSFTVSSPSMIGTIGNAINATAELKAPAPAGGIELYLSPFTTPGFNGTGVAGPNQRVEAGMRSVTFPIRYNDVVVTFSDLQMNSNAFSPTFETQTRRFQRIVALDPPGTKTWQPIPSRAIAVYFDVVPLVVSSITVQPASLPDTGEALATFVLSASPVSNSERVYPDTTGTGSRAVLLGASCAATSTFTAPPELQLTPGVTSYQFKVCGRTVTSPTTNQVQARMRSGIFSTNVTIQP